ncbi:PrsW family glutamic-type intramembrane protease [Leadbettera azotonutricia]|uniref:Protease PrsW n=1 Tax=Leadbettera azotonutricia (strain ATCC BAA-888 / DSM 13862 / ZAS-9) TaxID=545695 RepID=F5YF42_LEAAZ|nr:PrsW family glutamic-type intramembrane protease [Leadbettera azotonutricia]AEF82531.1 protease PrsW [Leadbettera azotonutricia ZAS-9]
MASIIVLLLSAVLPIVAFLLFIYLRDTQKEPLKPLMLCLLFGFLSSIPAVIIELLIGLGNTFASPLSSAIYDAFPGAAIPEELLKFLVLYLFVFKKPYFDQNYDGIVYAVFVSLGFAMAENISYVLQNGIGTALLRAIFSVPGHGLFAISMGYFFSLGRFSSIDKKKWYLFLSLFIPIIFHGTYDFLLFYISGGIDNTAIILLMFFALIALMIFMWKFALKRMEKYIIMDKNP